jgi:hypothetical protein
MIYGIFLLNMLVRLSPVSLTDFNGVRHGRLVLEYWTNYELYPYLIRKATLCFVYIALIFMNIAQSIQCLTTDWTARVRSPTEAENFSSNLCVQMGLGSHPASYTVGTGGSFPGGQAQPGRDAVNSPLSSAEVKKEEEL